jgi:hypothetical protein
MRTTQAETRERPRNSAAENAGPRRAGAQDAGARDGLLRVVENLTRYHHEHEKYYSEAPLVDALSLQRTSRTMIALAERWSTAVPTGTPLTSPFAGAPDLNDERAIETSGVLFLEGEGEPAEVIRIKGELATLAAASEQSSQWLSAAMESSWEMAKALLNYPELADLHGERHRVIANNWQNAWTAGMIARYLRRALEVLERVDFSPATLRTDLSGPRTTPAYLYSAAELINRAADLSAESSVLVHENERRWRVFHERVEQVSAHE